MAEQTPERKPPCPYQQKLMADVQDHLMQISQRLTWINRWTLNWARRSGPWGRCINTGKSTAVESRTGGATTSERCILLCALPITPFQVSRWRGGRYAYARVRPCMRARCGTCALRLLSRSGNRSKIFSCHAGSCPNTIPAPATDGTKVPKQHSKSIRAASAATASGSLETALSKVTRPSTNRTIPDLTAPRHFR